MSEIDRRQQILEGALQVFSTQGFHKASIKQIAKAAGIKSSALIYHYFDDKKALLNAVVQELSPLRDMPIINTDIHAQLMDVPPEMLLTQLAGNFLKLNADESMRNLMRLFLSEAVRMPEVANSLIETQATVLRFLIRYFTHQRDKGTFIEHNPESAARAFMGMLVINVMARIVFTPLAEGMPDNESYIKDVVHIFLNGLRRQDENHD